MAADEKDVQCDTGYYRYEAIGDSTLRTSAIGTVKTIQYRKVPVRGITLTVGGFFDGTGNNRANADDLRLAYTHCANLVGEERARAGLGIRESIFRQLDAAKPSQNSVDILDVN